MEMEEEEEERQRRVEGRIPAHQKNTFCVYVYVYVCVYVYPPTYLCYQSVSVSVCLSVSLQDRS